VCVYVRKRWKKVGSVPGVFVCVWQCVCVCVCERGGPEDVCNVCVCLWD